MQNGMFYKMFKTITRMKTRHFPVAFIICFSTVWRGRNNKFYACRSFKSRWPKVPWSQRFFLSTKMVSVYFANTVLMINTKSQPRFFQTWIQHIGSLPRRKFIGKKLDLAVQSLHGGIVLQKLSFCPRFKTT